MIPDGPGQPNNYVEFITDLKIWWRKAVYPQARIDDAVRRILRVKFQMGLFDNPYTDPALTAAIGSTASAGCARMRA